MKVGFYARWNEKRLAIAERFAAGVRLYGDEIMIRDVGTELTARDDIAILIGNKLRLDLPAGVSIIHLDKAYPFETLRRDHDHSRLSVDATHPTRYLMNISCRSDRRKRFGWQAMEWKRDGGMVLLFGGSRSYYEREGIADMQAHLQELVDRIRAATRLRIGFRPKPNMARHLQPMRGAEAVDPFAFLRPILANCRSTVVEESAAAIEAILCGVPTVVLGDAPTRPISSTSLDEVDRPRLADPDEVEELLNDLAYFQYSMAEFSDGTCWKFLRSIL